MSIMSTLRNSFLSFQNVKFDFSGKRALVVGGSKGIGREVVTAFSQAGADVIYASRTPIEKENVGLFHATDIHNEADITALFQKIDELGNLDFLVNSAAINNWITIENIETAEWDDVLAVNLRAAFLLCREAAIRMKKTKTGRIVNISSIAGRHRSPVAGVHYVSSKAGIIGLSKQLAFELAPHGVNVNVVCPSQTETEMLSESMDKEQLDKLAQQIPVRRLAKVEDQVGPIMFLCSDAASYITGAVVDVNGGQI